MTPKMVEQMFYPNAHPRKEAPLPDFEKVYKKLTDKNSVSVKFKGGTNKLLTNI